MGLTLLTIFIYDYNITYGDYNELVLEYNSLLNDYNESLNAPCKGCEMCGADIKFGVTGIYRANDYYCVYVENRTEAEINRTEIHEPCHHFVYMDYEHFCLGKA